MGWMEELPTNLYDSIWSLNRDHDGIMMIKQRKKRYPVSDKPISLAHWIGSKKKHTGNTYFKRKKLCFPMFPVLFF